MTGIPAQTPQKTRRGRDPATLHGAWQGAFEKWHTTTTAELIADGNTPEEVDKAFAESVPPAMRSILEGG